jgi:ABC-type multidrug transport system ATPase subunit
LSVGSGVLGLLGPNGAGKTTLMNILSTVTKPSRGRVTLNGTDIHQSPDAMREVLGYLPQSFGVYPHLTVVEFLNYLAALKGISGGVASKRIDDLLALIGLTGASQQPLSSFSGGMKQRVGIAQALLNDPQVLIVDEPTVGLDPEERVHFRNMIADLAGERLIILSTHIVSDVEITATRIALIQDGRLLRDETPEAFQRLAAGKVWGVTVSSDELIAYRKRHLVSSTQRRAGGVHLRVVADERPGQDAQALVPTLEDAYLYFTSNSGSNKVR